MNRAQPPMERPRRLDAAGALVLLVAATCVVGALAQRADAVLPGAAAERVLAERVVVDGVRVEHRAVLEAVVRRRGVGADVDTGAAAGVVRTVRETSDAVVAVTLTSALAYLAVAFAVLAPRRRRPGVTALFTAFLAAALLIAVGGPTAGRGPAASLLSLAYVIGFAVLPAAFLVAMIAFPGSAVRGARALSWVVGLAAAALAALAVLTWAPLLFAGAPLDAEDIARTTDLLGAAFVAGLVFGLCVLAWRALRGAEPLERRQAAWVLGGVALGAAPYALLRLVPRLLTGSEPAVSPALDRVVELAVPLAFAAAVARERLLDIDLIRRRGWIHSAVALAACAALFALLRAAFASAAAGSGEWGAALAVGLPAALFVPLRRGVSPVLDRRLFGLDGARERALEGLPALLGALDTPADVLRTARSFVALHLDAQPVHAALAVSGGEPLVSGDGAPDAAALLATRSPPPAGLAHVAHALAPDGARAAVALGAKRGGRGFAVEDEAFAQRVAQALAEAGERVALRRRLLAQEAERVADAALAAKKADFFARVAHDLRTPVASIRWSVRNLEDGVVGELAPGQRDYLAAVSAAAAQLARLVDHLVEIGRLDLGAGLAAHDRVRWDGVAREVLSVLAPVAGARGVRLELDVAGEVAPVRGRDDGAARVLQNLLDNAVKHSPTGGVVDVVVARTGDGGVVVSVRDHGPGLPPGDAERLFELFARGPEGGATPGFGIGLHVVRAWTRAMGGTVRAADASGGGAVFECRFPPAPHADPEAPRP